ncbi:unnamed protein product, partial [Staurois parvus]
MISQCHLSVSITASCQCSSMPPASATSMPHSAHLSCLSVAPSVPVSATYQCQSVPPISAANQCHLSVPVSAAYQGQSMPPISVHQ